MFISVFHFHISSHSCSFFNFLFCLQLVLLLSALLGKEKFFDDHCDPPSSISSTTADKKSKRDRGSDEVR